MTPREIGIGLVGCGHAAHLHTAALRDAARAGVPVRPVAAADPSEPARRGVARNFPFERFYDGWRALVADDDVDAVYVCTPTATHRDIYLGVLEAGKHLYAEKPIAPSFAEVREICAAADTSSAVIQVGFQTRFQAVMARARDLVLSGELGPPMTYVWRDDEAFPTTAIDPTHSDWRSDAALAGGGVLLEHSIHGLDVLHWTFGIPATVSASVRHVLGFDVEDTAALHISHESGLAGVMATVYGGVTGRTESRFEVLCEQGVVEVTWGGAVLVDDPALTMRVQRAGEPPEDVDTGEVLTAHLDALGIEHRPFFWQEVATTMFARAVQGGGPASPGPEDSLVAHATVEAAYRSAAESRVVALTEVLDPD